MMSKLQELKEVIGVRTPEQVVAQASAPSWDVRFMRLFIVGILTVTAVHVLDKLLHKPILEANKLEVGLLLGWLIAKSGTVIDWLFGGSESGSRRADLNAHQAANAPPIGSQQITAPGDAKVEAQVDTPNPEEPPLVWKGKE